MYWYLEIDLALFETKFLLGESIISITCNNICHRYRAKKPNDVGRYLSGQKRCNPCEIYINWDGRHCPCCGIMLRTKPRSKAYKQRFNLKLQNK